MGSQPNLIIAYSRHNRAGSDQSEQRVNELIDWLIIGLDHMIGGRLILWRSFLQHVLDFIDERLGPCQRGALRIPADSFRDRLD